MIDLKHEIDFSTGIHVIGHFTYPKCPACDSAKEFLKEKGKQYQFIQADKKLFGKILQYTKTTTVPQIFIEGEFIGGYDDLVNYNFE